MVTPEGMRSLVVEPKHMDRKFARQEPCPVGRSHGPKLWQCLLPQRRLIRLERTLTAHSRGFTEVSIRADRSRGAEVNAGSRTGTQSRSPTIPAVMRSVAGTITAGMVCLH